MDRVNDTMTVSEVAQTMHVHVATVRRWIYKGLLEAVGIPCAGDPKRHIWRISRRSLAKMLHTHETNLPVLPA